MLQRIWAFGLMERWFCIWDDLANPNNLLCKSKGSTRRLGLSLAEVKKNKRMNLDKILCIAYAIPFFMVLFYDEKLRINRIFIKFLILSILILIIGITIENYRQNEQKSLSYYISQMMLIHLISQRILRNLFKKIYHKEPKLERAIGTFEDKTYSIILFVIVVSLPFVIDSFIIEKLFK
jgi:hypothetical protein